MTKNERVQPFLLRFVQPMPMPAHLACEYDPREQRCIVDHRCVGGTSTMEYTTGYTPWTGQEDKD